MIGLALGTAVASIAASGFSLDGATAESLGIAGSPPEAFLTEPTVGVFDLGTDDAD